MHIFFILVLVAFVSAQYNYEANSGESNLSEDNVTGDFPVSGTNNANELEKEFYTFTADEKDYNDPAANQQLANSVKQSLRVIFIKGPENKALQDAAFSLAKQVSQQQTAIYVLSKQSDIQDLSNRLNNLATYANHKPAVNFVKYRTAEDAAYAKNAIQNQYDNLGGYSQSIDGGIVPILNFASQAPGYDHIGSPTASYLPQY